MEGLTIVEVLRREGSHLPVLVLSALGTVDDRVRGLRAGGDDYLTKPFATLELVARVEALLRRPTENSDTMLRVGPLELDLIERTARRRPCDQPSAARVSAARIHDAAQGPDVDPRHAAGGGVETTSSVPQTNLVDVHMGRLRRKVDEPDEPPMIHNVRGAGFVLRAPS